MCGVDYENDAGGGEEKQTGDGRRRKAGPGAGQRVKERTAAGPLDPHTRDGGEGRRSWRLCEVTGVWSRDG